jgi:hypothetical protein
MAPHGRARASLPGRGAAADGNGMGGGLGYAWRGPDPLHGTHPPHPPPFPFSPSCLPHAAGPPGRRRPASGRPAAPALRRREGPAGPGRMTAGRASLRVAPGRPGLRPPGSAAPCGVVTCRPCDRPGTRAARPEPAEAVSARRGGGAGLRMRRARSRAAARPVTSRSRAAAAGGAARRAGGGGRTAGRACARDARARRYRRVPRPITGQIPVKWADAGRTVRCRSSASRPRRFARACHGPGRAAAGAAAARIG